MSENDQSPSGTPDNSSGGTQGGGNNSVSYESHQKLLAEKKAAQKKLEELEAREKEREEKALQEQGKHKELLEAREKENKQLKEDLQKSRLTFGRQAFESAAKSMALELGANPEALDDLIKVGDWSSVTVGDNYQVNKEELKAALAGMQEKKPFYFTKSPKPPKDINLGGGGGSPVGVSDFDKLSADEIVQMAREGKIK